jgi:hypothetical protein
MKKFLVALLITLPCFAKAQVSSFVNAPGGNVGIATTTPAALFTVGNGTLAVTSAGNIGIGVASPGGALDVEGPSGRNVIFNTGGNVGIGTASPGTLLDVNGTETVRGPLTATSSLTITGYFGAGGADATLSGSVFALRDSSINGDEAAFFHIGSTMTLFGQNHVGSAFAALGLDGTPLQLNYDTNANVYLAYGGGKVGIGTNNPARTLTVVGDIRVGTSGTNGCVEQFAGTALVGTCASDSRLKINIREITGTLDIVKALRPVTYEWSTDPAIQKLYRHGKSVNYGLVAQDVEKVLPDLVQTDKNGYKNVSYGLELQMLNLRALQELNAKVDAIIAALNAKGIPVTYSAPAAWTQPRPVRSDTDYPVPPPEAPTRVRRPR